MLCKLQRLWDDLLHKVTTSVLTDAHTQELDKFVFGVMSLQDAAKTIKFGRSRLMGQYVLNAATRWKILHNGVALRRLAVRSSAMLCGRFVKKTKSPAPTERKTTFHIEKGALRRETGRALHIRLQRQMEQYNGCYHSKIRSLQSKRGR